jgi:transcription elongation factor Elf1
MVSFDELMETVKEVREEQLTQMINCDFCNHKFPVDDIDIEINFGRYMAYCGKCDK